MSELDEATLAGMYAPPDAPWLRVNMVTSIDGAVEVGGRSGYLSDPRDQQVMRVLRMTSDAILIGAGTFRVEGYGGWLLDEHRRADRARRGLAAHPRLVIVSGSLLLDPRAPGFTEAPEPPIILTHEAAPPGQRERLSAVAEVVTTGENAVDLVKAVSLLHQRGLIRVLSEGGPHLLNSLIAADLVDELCLTISPLLTAAGASRIVAGPPAPLRRMVLHHALPVDDLLFLRYQRA